VRLDTLPKSVIDIFVTVIECDGIESCVATATVAASTSLAKAGIEMLGLVVSCAGVSPYYLLILVLPHNQLSGRDWGGCLVGSKRRRGAIGIWNVVMRMYARIGRDDQCLADWSRPSIQGIDGERQGVLHLDPPTNWTSTLESTTMSRSLFRYPSDSGQGPSRRLRAGIERHTVVETRSM
jgi:hypothetical protein